MLWKIVVVPQKVELRVTIGLSNFTPTYKPNRNENKFPDKNSFMKVHSSQKVETTNESTNAWINEMWYIHMMQYHSRIKRNEVLMHSMTWMNLGFFVAVFFFFGPLCGIWSSQAKDHIQVTVATYATTSAMLTLLTHCARPGNKPASSCTDATHPVVPQRELPTQMTLEDIIQSERRHGDCFMGASSPLGVMERFLN